MATKMKKDEVERAKRDPYAFVGDFRLSGDGAQRIRDLANYGLEQAALAKMNGKVVKVK